MSQIRFTTSKRKVVACAVSKLLDGNIKERQVKQALALMQTHITIEGDKRDFNEPKNRSLKRHSSSNDNLNTVIGSGLNIVD